jgi:hypothetical protein
MPCIFLENLSEKSTEEIAITRYLISQFYKDIAAICGTDVEEVQLHIKPGLYTVFTPDGDPEENHGVHAFIVWNAGRSIEVKETLAVRLYEFLRFYRLHEGLDITFCDMPPGTSFWFGGKMVQAPPSELPPAA